MKDRCIQCCTLMVSKRKGAKFCSNECKNVYWNFRLKEEKKNHKSVGELTEKDIKKIKVSRPDLFIKFD